MNKKGFISTSVIFAFFIAFLMLLMIIITSYAQNRILMNQVKKDIKSNLVGKYNYTDLSNPNIVEAYTYNQISGASNYCVTGDEETCEVTTCYESNDANSCASGTIIDYKVNDNDTVRFHVMYDNGNNLIMQSQKNTIDSTRWSTDSNVLGPTIILPELENVTSNWSNVNNQTYAMGTTIFKENAYTGCFPASTSYSYNDCLTNTYTLEKEDVKSRMITYQEAVDLGCSSAEKSCPIWMYNFLNAEINNQTYCTMSANSSPDNQFWHINYEGTIDRGYIYHNHGARAVVEINK